MSPKDRGAPQGPALPSIDALTPSEMAQKGALLGLKKTQTGIVPLLVLAVLAGAFIAFGAVFATVSTTVAPGTAALPYGPAKVLMGVAFSVGTSICSAKEPWW